MFALEQYSLKFAPNALGTYMSENTVNFHYKKHLDTYIKNLNGFISGTNYENMELADIIKNSVSDESSKKIFNNAAQVFNHNFFFNGLANGDNGQVPERILSTFGTIDNFKSEFKNAALGLFGSGWVWLVEEAGNLKIITTANADTPIAHGIKPILTLDVWEHAYYLDYQNKRAEFVDVFLNHLIDWNFVENNM